MSKLFKIGKDGVTFESINKSEFKAAIKGLDKESKALARGYFNAINSKETHTVEVVKRSEKLSSASLASLKAQHDNVSKTGLDIDKNHGGGFSGSTPKDGIHAIVVMDSKSKIEFQYSDNVARASLPGEILAHELIGHGMGGRVMLTDGKDEAVQAGNLFLKAAGYTYYRKDHGLQPNDPNTNPRGIPSYLTEYDPFNPFD